MCFSVASDFEDYGFLKRARPERGHALPKEAARSLAADDERLADDDGKRAVRATGVALHLHILTEHLVEDIPSGQVFGRRGDAWGEALLAPVRLPLPVEVLQLQLAVFVDESLRDLPAMRDVLMVGYELEDTAVPPVVYLMLEAPSIGGGGELNFA